MSELDEGFANVSNIKEDTEKNIVELKGRIEYLEKEIEHLQDDNDEESAEIREQVEFVKNTIHEAKMDYDRLKDLKQKAENECSAIKKGAEYITQHHEKVMRLNLNKYLAGEVKKNNDKEEDPPKTE
ncbi:hypothetical protein FO519_010457, partial [Halicephalobus sp. NKZ332]